MQIPLLRPTEEAMQHGQCMLEPKVEARMLQDLHVKPHEKVLEVGAGSGYMAALLAHRAQRVISLEIDPGPGAHGAAPTCSAPASRNVEVREADGAKGLPAEAPFDVIVLSGSVAEVPAGACWRSSRSAAGWPPIVGDRAGDARHLHHPHRRRPRYTTAQPWDTVAPRLAHFPEPRASISDQADP